MRVLKCVFVACLAIFSASSAWAGPSKYKEALVGKWQNDKNAKAMLDFTKDGKLNAGPLSGTYVLAADDIVTVTTAKPFNGKTTFKATISIVKDTMTMIDPDEAVTIWKRVK